MQTVYLVIGTSHLKPIHRIFETMELAEKFERFLKELLWDVEIKAIIVEDQWEE